MSDLIGSCLQEVDHATLSDAVVPAHRHRSLRYAGGEAVNPRHLLDSDRRYDTPEVIQHLGQPTTSMTLADSETVRYGRSPQLSQPPSVPSVVATPQGYMTVTPTATPNFED